MTLGATSKALREDEDAPLAALGVADDTLCPDEQRQLDERGFLCLGTLISPEAAAESMALIEQRCAGRGGAPTLHGTLHLDGLLTAEPAFVRLWSHPRVLAAAAHLLGGDMRAVELAYRAPTPGHGEQTLHIDWSSVPEGCQAPVCSVIFALVDFTADNGSTRVVPGSHRCGKKPKHTSPAQVHPGEQRLVGPAGSGFVVHGLLWHSGTRNHGSVPRHSLSASFRRRGVEAFDREPRALPDWLPPAAARLAQR